MSLLPWPPPRSVVLSRHQCCVAPGGRTRWNTVLAPSGHFVASSTASRGTFARRPRRSADLFTRPYALV
eukprot:8412455-Lingulodinium_polyedra.AAC.1